MFRRVFTLALVAFSLPTVAARADASQGEGPKPQEAASASGAPAVSPEAPTETAVLHVTSHAAVNVEKDGTGEVVCTSPCDKRLPARERYRIGGERPSPAFTLTPTAEGKAKLKVRPAHASSFWLGVGALGLGTGLVAGGASLLIHGYATRAPVQGADGVTTDNSFTDAMVAGSALVLFGLVSGIWGGSTVLQHHHTKVYGDMQTAAVKDRSLLAQPVQSPLAAVPGATSVSVFGGIF